MKSLWLLGPGNSLSHYREGLSQLGEEDVLAYQREAYKQCAAS